ncbi:MAG: hypothetical protein ABFD94_04245 [Armatimonadia bacterium]
MKVEIKKIAVTIDEREGRELMNQINKLAGSITLCTDLKGTALERLFALLQGNFESGVAGVHFNRN